ncbi:MAG: hypothetical protein IJ756_05725 [Paludibacteraceae bacterium]|nr:hypothetical protein [Paludibacteraceae bacterium]MBR1786643.1 hypothetical protein [Paludibacteraceae bacterium]
MVRTLLVFILTFVCTLTVQHDCLTSPTLRFETGMRREALTECQKVPPLAQLSQLPFAQPVQIEEINVVIAHVVAKQIRRHLSETVFGTPANLQKTYKITRQICLSHSFPINLPSFNISFPFSTFW